MPKSPGKVIFTSPRKHTGSCQCVLAQLSTPDKQADTKPELQGSRKEKCSERTGALRISKGASCPWQNPLSVKAVSHSCVGKRFSKRMNPSAKCRFGFGRSELGPESLHSGGCWPAHHTWTSKALGDQSQPSLRTPAALTPASLIISFKLTHSWKKEKPTIKTLILPHLWVSFFQHIMSHCDNYATSSCSTYLQPKKQRPSINTCYIISTHWILSHSLLKICLFICLSFPFDYQSLEDRAIPCAVTWRLTRKEHSVPSADSAQGLHT